MVDYNLFQLPNGIRIVHKEVPNTKIVHCGFILDIGSRDERENQLGIAHFWEHMAFKGTKKRKAFHILNRLDSVGGELNAYTTKEKICFYASALERHTDSAFELLQDITFDSIFPEKQIENERGVILEEMALYKDSPEDAIQDEFDNVVFGEHPLGQNILGTPNSVKSFRRADFQNFVKQNLNTERVVFSCVGGIPFKKVKRLAEKYFGKVPHFKAEKQRIAFGTYSPQTKVEERAISQAHCAIGSTAFELGHDDRLKFFMLLNILGGPGMNSRLNLALREKYGFVYNVEAAYHPYSDTGLFAIFYGTEKSQANRSRRLVMKELKKLREKPLGTMQLHSAKEQLVGQLAMAEENNVNLMLMMGKSILDLERIESLDSIFKNIRSVTSTELLDIANATLQDDKMSFLTFLPQD
ncbi:M16 family metallopeptidase [Roseivirga pacifica]|uniref:M16 family metallopeptidase n=1 Tax=Roseivirga pacifica TaxID=1267423 RepID=UPI0020940911|nr:pitrilysin family protein [Roseivirga pacifica]MCO6359956.1 insulinase family protein [Roseivirga pacifica]MCO6367326.1 insulinase family protein [Roseivirga pacifica]MCO6370142.1 insulinase family protein [Roseivirga pacifica]MCO6374983.1 insulinase family protein [Roseivirga pacifica]MCO6380241.1 insulinase family protein [Roseivirga pacifica]